MKKKHTDRLNAFLKENKKQARGVIIGMMLEDGTVWMVTGDTTPDEVMKVLVAYLGDLTKDNVGVIDAEGNC